MKFISSNVYVFPQTTKLREVLLAYSWHNLDVGYCQVRKKTRKIFCKTSLFTIFLLSPLTLFVSVFVILFQRV